MATTWNAIYLGRFTSTTFTLDPTEGNTNSERAANFVGQTYGSNANPLYNNIHNLQTIDNGGTLVGGVQVMDQNNSLSNDFYRTDLNRDGTIEQYTHDGSATFNTTITYFDNTTATATLVIFQTTTGELFVGPALNDATNQLLTAKAIKSIGLTSVANSTNIGGLQRDRPSLEFACFAAGALILTDRGEVAVEQLAIGDLVVTADHGPQPIRWIGQATVDLVANPNLCPVRIRAGALGDQVPEADLVVSPQHRVLVRSKIAQRMFGTDEVLVAAKQLLELDGIELAEDLDHVTYVHFLFDDHQVVWSNRAQTESLFTGPEALRRVGPAARDEILAIFPELGTPETAAIRVPVRPLVHGRQARRMASRHMVNGKHLVN